MIEYSAPGRKAIPGNSTSRAGSHTQMARSSAKHQLRPTALTPEDAAQLLTSLGGKTVTVETIRADIDAGAPVNADDTVNLVDYEA